jgi:hypothetical protein
MICKQFYVFVYIYAYKTCENLICESIAIKYL